RPPFWNKANMLELLDDVHWLKLNEQELAQLSEKDDMESSARQLKIRYGLEGIVVTCGSRGAFALGKDDIPIRVMPEQVQAVKDTVGAGDAFSSILLLGLLRSWTLKNTLTRAQQFASAVVGIRGAVSTEKAFYQQQQSW
ncbi:MAG: carbohydrate kinase family protein, partial [Candidatus Electrothrix sp. AR4]|nr:carbohydrate kinase family protein [Candidatus Electrothrix sp. AR4]